MSNLLIIAFVAAAVLVLALVLLYITSKRRRREKLAQKNAFISPNSPQPYIEYHPNGKIKKRYHKEAGKVQGLLETFYENGNISSKQQFFEGLPQGIQEFYYPKGQLKERYHSEAGKVQGKFEAFREADGRLSMLRQYLNDAILEEENYTKEGKISQKQQIEPDGALIITQYSYHENGQLASKGATRNGKKQGEWEFFDEAGNLTQKTVYHMGEFQA